jgi:uncharacterized protein (TIGR00251 family)
MSEKGEPNYYRVKVIPKSPRSELVETMADGTLKIRIAAPAEKGQANAALVKFLSEHFAVPKETVTIISGQSNRLKLVKIDSHE